MGILESFCKFIYDDDEICYGCGSKTENRNHICSSCRSCIEYVENNNTNRVKYIDEMYSVAYYNGLLRELIHKYKYEKASYLSNFFGELLVEFLLEKQIISRIDEIYYVPTYKSVEANRAYNQCRLIANYLGEVLDVKVDDGNLYKSGNTYDQIDLSGKERRENLKDVFSVKDKHLIKGKNILLIDDIITTGTTLERCGETLKKSGCSEIIGLSITTTHH
ncbi:MAG: ComF family protein [Tissierellia bacterium]|nr:ComF family protein [Tissierellia bacterium]